MFNKLRPFIPLLLSLVFALVLVFLVDDFVHTVIVVPLFHVAWFVALVIRSLPQAVIWAGFILILLIFSFISLPKRKRIFHYSDPSAAHQPGPVEKWANLLERSRKSRFSKWLLAQELKRLTKRLYLPIEEENWRSSDLPKGLPAEIADYFNARQPIYISYWKRVRAEEIKTPLDLDPEIVLQYLENQPYLQQD
ncbi:MAG: hypothetical protein H6636_01610 [Anaerolineales bacterium]|nr:hypothetical protein [Anaerolineales bacterium]